ncbi:MAG: PAS domain S-box protein [Desulfatibacillum sp.]|nr:PAS domain S-box protein [Desulfatibacillum sp.]
MFLSIDSSGVVLTINRKALQVLGFTRSELVGQNISQTLLPKNPPGQEGLSSVLGAFQDEAGKYFSARAAMQCKNGSLIPITWSFMRIPGNTDQEQEIHCIGTPMEELAFAERDLTEERERHAALLQATGDWIWEVNLQGAVTYSTPSVFDITGYAAEELMGKDLASILTPKGEENFLEQHIRSVCFNGRPFQGREISVSHKDGRPLFVDISGLPIVDSTGQPTGVRGVTRNITNHQWAKEALRKSEEKYRSFIESAPIGMMISDTNGHITYGNRKLVEITGYGVAEWQGRSYIEMVYPEDYGIIVENRTRAIRTLDPVDPFEIRVYNSKGELIWLRLIPHSVYKADGQGNTVVAYFQNFIEDITASKNAREEKKRLEQQLSQTHKMEALGTLAGGVAHDFNNILYPIIGYTEMTLAEVSQYPFAAENLEEVLQAAKRAQKLVNQILAFSRDTEEKLRPIRIQPVLEDVLSLVRPSLPANVLVKREIQKTGGVVMADPTRLHQVVMNLCTNAYQSMGDLGGVLSITLDQCVITRQDLPEYPQLTAGNYVRLTISDNGAGMDEATKERIFEPYFTTKAVGKGTGMGLAVVHGIVTKCKGAIKVDSAPGMGSSFTVLLPFINKTPGELPSRKSAPLPKGTEHILLTYGERQILELSEKMFTRLGYTVAAFTSGKEALQAFCNNSGAIDLVLANAALEDMTGEMLIEKVLTIRPDLPSILISSLSEESTEDGSNSSQISKLIAKPLDIIKVAMGIRKVLDGKN